MYISRCFREGLLRDDKGHFGFLEMWLGSQMEWDWGEETANWLGYQIFQLALLKRDNTHNIKSSGEGQQGKVLI